MLDPPKHEECGLSSESRLCIMDNIKQLFTENIGYEIMYSIGLTRNGLKLWVLETSEPLKRRKISLLVQQLPTY